MQKKLCIVLACVFVLFLALGLLLNCQQGIDFDGTFWRRQKDGSYVCGRNWIIPLSDGDFEICLSGEMLYAKVSYLPDRTMHMDYSDGWAVERGREYDFLYDFGPFAWSADAELILTDMKKQDFRFAAAAREERSAIYDETGEHILGETISLLSEDGAFLDQWTTWLNAPELSDPERETILLEEGARLPSNPYGDCALKNSAGEYLLDAQKIGRIHTGGANLERSSFTWFLTRISEGASEARGEAMQVFCFALLYILGAALLLCPEKMAFLGSRWQYKNEPELSDAGVTAMQISGGVLMLLGILMLFIGL